MTFLWYRFWNGLGIVVATDDPLSLVGILFGEYFISMISYECFNHVAFELFECK